MRIFAIAKNAVEAIPSSFASDFAIHPSHKASEDNEASSDLRKASEDDRQFIFPARRPGNLKAGPKQHGHTLVEVLIALFILVVMLLLYSAASNSVILNRDAKHKELALRILVSKMEDLRATDFDSLPVSGALTHPLLGQLPSSTLDLIMVDVDTSLKSATVVIGWQDAVNFNSRQLKLATYISNQGL